MDVPLPIAEARVAKRNFAAGLSPSLTAALDRTRRNDMRNAHDVLENRVGGGLIRESVGSVEDEGWKSEGLKRVEGELEEEARKGRRMGEEGGDGDGDGGGGEERPPGVSFGVPVVSFEWTADEGLLI